MDELFRTGYHSSSDDFRRGDRAAGINDSKADHAIDDHSNTVHLINNLLVILASGMTAGMICRRLGVSMLIGYLLVGVLVGENALRWVVDDQAVVLLAEAGVLFLLFSIGLEFSLEELSRLSRYLIIGGGAQMLLSTIPATVVLMISGLGWRSALLLAFATALSSTVLVFKTLAEYGQTASPHGRRAIGVLLFQDIALVPLLLLVPLLTGAPGASEMSDYLLLAIRSVCLVGGVLLLRRILTRWIIPLLASMRSPELVVLFSLVLLGGVTMATTAAGLPASIGAFAAGLALSGNRLTGQIDALILPFRECFSAVFFVSLGLLMDPLLYWHEGGWVLGALAALLLVKSSAGAVALRLTNLSWTASLGMGIGLAQVGEFAFVLALQAVEAKMLSPSDYQRLLAVALGSLILTPLLLKIGLRLSERGDAIEHSPGSELPSLPGAAAQAIVIGIGPVGRQVASRLEIAGIDICLIDLSPVNLQSFAQMGFRTVAGDASDPEVLDRAGAKNAELIVVSVPDDRVTLEVVGAIRSINTKTVVVARCRYLGNTNGISRAGANAVVSEEAEASVAVLRLLVGIEQQLGRDLPMVDPTLDSDPDSADDSDATLANG